MRNSVTYPRLLRCPLLSELPAEQKTAFIDAGIIRRYPGRTEVISQGEPVPGFFVVAQGRVEVTYCDSNGHMALVHIAAAGDLIGDIGAIGGLPGTATCTTLANSVLLFCRPSLVDAHLKSPLLLRNLCRIHYERILHDNWSRAVSQFYSVDQRLAIYLCELTSERRPEIRVSQSSLASIIGCSRQTVNAKLGELRDAGAIRLGKAAITVLDRARLAGRIEGSSAAP